MRLTKIIFLAAVLLSNLSPSFSQTNEKNPAANPAALDHLQPYLIALSVPDVEATAKWYREKLGFTSVKRMNLPEYSLRIEFLELNGFRLELIENKKSFSIKKYVPDYSESSALLQGVGKFAFLVKDARAFAESLKKCDVRFVLDVRDDKEFGVRFFIIADDNGNLIQFIQKLI